MIHKELVEILEHTAQDGMADEPILKALRAVVELHQPQDITLPDGSWGENCSVCDIGWTYPCLTIQVIEKKLK